MNEGAVTYPDDKRVLTTLYEDLMKITTQDEKQVEQKETLCDKCRKEQQMIDKACEWLIKGGYFVNNTETIEDFKNYMKGE